VVKSVRNELKLSASWASPVLLVLPLVLELATAADVGEVVLLVGLVVVMVCPQTIAVTR
jgi:hypothetical protein